MNWFDIVHDADFLEKLYVDPPSLKGIRLFEIGIHQDGPRIRFRFNINEFPRSPPTHWIQQGANVVQIRLTCVGIQSLEMHGWSTDNVVDMFITSSATGLRLRLEGATTQFEGLFDGISIDSVSAYQRVEE